MMCMDGIFNKYLQKYKNIDIDEVFNNVEEIMEDFNQYMKILKFAIYNEEK